MKRAFVIACCCGLSGLQLADAPARAQSVLPFNIGDAVRQSQDSQVPPLQQPAPTPVLPQLVEPQFTLKDKETLRVRRFVVEGPGLVGETEVRDILAPYENRSLTLAQIYAAADQITALYRNQGYIVAKAYVPAQDARSGVLRIQVLPGQYGPVTVKNQSLVGEAQVQGVIDRALTGSAYIHKDGLERAMLLISDMPGAPMPRVAIGPGQQPGTSDFVFDVPEGRRIDGFLVGDNYGSPYTGRDRLSGGFNLNSPLGIGDRLAAFGIVTQDTNLLNGQIAYSLPLGSDGLRGEISAFRTTYVLGGVYDDLNATGTANALAATLTYPLRRQRDDSIYLSGNYTYKALNDNILGVSFAERNINLGTAAISRETAGTLFGMPLATTASFSVTAGYVDFPNATQRAENIATVDTVGAYARLNLSIVTTLALSEKLSLTTNFRGQKSLTGNLDSSEQLGLTGYWGIRSYDEGLAGDSGYIVTPELKYALPDINAYRHSVGLFTDIGGAWIENPSYTVTQKSYTQLNDVGLGYYATYEYAAGRYLLLKAQVAFTCGSDDGAQSYNYGTKGLGQIGFTF